MLFLINYELQDPRNDDSKIREALEAVNARRILRTTWGLSSDNSSTAGLLAYLGRHVGPDDRVLVTEVQEEAWSAANALLDLRQVNGSHVHAAAAAATPVTIVGKGRGPH